MNKRSKRNESNERVLGQKLNRLRERGAQEPDLLFDDARVDDKEENRGYGGVIISGAHGGVGVVLDGGVLREELGGEGVVGDGGVVRGEVVALEAEGADPDLGGEVDDAEGVEDGAARAAPERGVVEERHRGEVLYGSVDGGDGDDGVLGVLLRARDHVPRHSHAVLGFEIQKFGHGEREGKKSFDLLHWNVQFFCFCFFLANA